MLTHYREKVLRTLRLWILLLGSVAVVSEIIAAQREQRLTDAVVYLSVFLLAVFLLYAPPFSLRIRTIGVISLIYLVAVENLASGYLMGSGRLWLLAFCAVSGAMLGTKVALAAVAASAVTYVGFLGAFHLRLIPRVADVTFDDPNIATIVLMLIILGVFVSLPASFLLSYLTRALVVEKNQRITLEDLNRETIDLNRSLQTLNDSVANSLRPALRRMQLIACKLEENPDAQAIIESDLLTRFKKDIVRLDAQLSDAQVLSRTGAESVVKMNIPIQETIDSALASSEDEVSDRLAVRVDKDLFFEADKKLLAMLFQYLFRYFSHMVPEDKKVAIRIARITYEERACLSVTVQVSGSKFLAGGGPFVMFYSPFLSIEANIAGIELVLIQRIVTLHGWKLHSTSPNPDEIDILLVS